MARNDASDRAIAGALTATGTVKGANLATTMRAVTAAGSLNTTTDGTLLLDGTSGAFSLTVPTGNSASAGRLYHLIKIDSSVNAITLAGSFNGVTNYTLSSQNQGICIQWDNTNTTWRVLAAVAIGSNAAASLVSALPSISAATDTALYLLRQSGNADALYIAAQNALGHEKFAQVALIFPSAKGDPAGYSAPLEAWLCNDTTGTTLAAAITPANDNLTATVSGDFGSDSVGNYYAPNNSSYATGSTISGLLTGTGDFSVEAYVRTGTVSSAGLFISSQGQDTGANAGIVYELYANNAGFGCLMGIGSSEPQIHPSSTVLANTTYHVVFIYVASSNTMTIYVNATSLGTASSGGTRNNLTSGSGLKTKIGTGDGRNSSTYEWNGRIYFVKLYNRAMSSTEVTARYSNL